MPGGHLTISALTPVQPLSAAQHSLMHAPLAVHHVSRGLLPSVWQPPCNERSEVVHRQQAVHQAPGVGHQLHRVPQRLRPAGIELLNLPLQSLQHQLHAAKYCLSLEQVILPLQSSSMQVLEMHLHPWGFSTAANTSMQRVWCQVLMARSDSCRPFSTMCNVCMQLSGCYKSLKHNQQPHSKKQLDGLRTLVPRCA